jgi:hypothetical protein
MLSTEHYLHILGPFLNQALLDADVILEICLVAVVSVLQQYTLRSLDVVCEKLPRLQSCSGSLDEVCLPEAEPRVAFQNRLTHLVDGWLFMKCDTLFVQVTFHEIAKSLPKENPSQPSPKSSLEASPLQAKGLSAAQCRRCGGPS